MNDYRGGAEPAWWSSLAGKAALVTGAGNGLGRSYARWLAARGVRVVVNNRRRSDVSSARTVVDEILGAGGVAVADEHSVADAAGCRAMVDRAEAEFGQLDILVCNAGAMVRALYDRLDGAEFEQVMEVNFWGSVRPVMEALPEMARRGWGRVVMTTSSAGLFGDSGGAYYAASRSAIVGFVRSVGLETEGTGVRVNMIAPSAATAMARSAQTLSPGESELMDPDTVAPVVGWLCSDDCRESGLILHAGCGMVRRIKVMGGVPVDGRDGDVGARWSELDDMAHAFEARSTMESGRVLREAAIRERESADTKGPGHVHPAG